MPRLFVAVPVPPHAGLEDVQRALGPRERGVKAVRLDQAHVTLKFLGHVPDERVDAVRLAAGAALAGIPAHEGAVAGVGAFPSARSARVVWAGIHETRLTDLAAAMDDAFEPLGFERERRAFRAHLTLARLDPPRDVTRVLEPFRERAFGPVPVREVVLFRSVLSPKGAEYTPLQVWPLGGAADALA